MRWLPDRNLRGVKYTHRLPIKKVVAISGLCAGIDFNMPKILNISCGQLRRGGVYLILRNREYF